MASPFLFGYSVNNAENRSFTGAGEKFRLFIYFSDVILILVNLILKSKPKRWPKKLKFLNIFLLFGRI